VVGAIFKLRWRECTYPPDDDLTLLVEDDFIWPLIPVIRNLVTEWQAAALAGRLLRSRTALIIHDHFLMKTLGTSIVAPTRTIL
jgi:hypothetical protein